jgi:glycosyltransferase involved in cell wall biosynthesis
MTSRLSALADSPAETNGRRPLRLLQLVQVYPPAEGGVPQSVSAVCERLVSDYGTDVSVFTTNALTTLNFRDASLPTLPIEEGEERNGVRVRRFPVDTRWASWLRYPQSAAFRLGLPGNGRLRTAWSGPIVPKMLRSLRDEQADVICAATFPFHHLTYPFRLPQPRPPIVLVGAIHTENRWLYHRQNLIRLIDQCYAIVVHTEHERRWLIAQGAPADRVCVIGHGIEVQDAERGRFRKAQGIPSDAFVVAYVGVHGSHKGIDTLLEALPRLLATREDAFLVIAGGETPYSATLRGLIAQLPEPARVRVRMISNLSEELKAEVLADCDVFASPSREEAFGITTLEAWAQARPVVVGDSPGQSSVVEDGALGLIVPHADVQSLLDALTTLASDEALRKRLGGAGHERLRERYQMSAVIRQYHTLFSEAAASVTVSSV